MPEHLTSIDDPQPGVLSYRAFRLDRDGVVRDTEIIAARSDDEARAIARGLANGFGIDLWERSRFLASFPPIEVGDLDH